MSIKLKAMKILYFFLLIFMIPFLSLAQQDYPFFSESNTWNIKTTSGNPVEPDIYHSVYQVMGDTMLDGKVYKKLMNDNNIFAYGYDEDNKSYMRPFNSNDTTDILLFDFNLNIGDSFQFYNPETMWDTTAYFLEVYGIDSLMLDDGSLRKRISFLKSSDISNIHYGLCPWAWAWIDGIGMSYHPIYIYPDCFETVYELECYAYNGIEIFGECDPESVIEVEEAYFNITPNPFQDQILVDLDQGQITSLKLYDLTGRLLKQSTSNNLFGLSNLQKGIYLLEIVLENQQVYSRKLIKA